MATISYKIVSTTTQDRECLQNSITFIQFPQPEQVWIVQNPNEQEIIKIQFASPSIVKHFSIRTRACKTIKIMLYNVVDGNEIQQKYLETINFLSRDQFKQIQNNESNEILYTYAQITFYRMEKELSIINLSVFGQTQQLSQQKIYNYPPTQQLSSNKRQNLSNQFVLTKPYNQELTLEIKKTPQIQLNQNNQISQRSNEIVNKSKQQLLNNVQQKLFFNPQSNSEKQIKKSFPNFNSQQSDDQLLLRALEESMKTHQDELRKQQKQKQEQIELEELIEQFYEEEKDGTTIKDELLLEKQIEQEFQNQQRFSQQKSLLKQQLYNENKGQVQIQVKPYKQMEVELNFEEMTQYHSNMIQQSFMDFHLTLEESFCKSLKLKNILNQKFKPLQNHRIFIVPDLITEFEYEKLQLKAINLGAIIEKAVTENTTLIISDKPVELDRKLNIYIVNCKFIEHCSYDKMPKIEKFLVK